MGDQNHWEEFFLAAVALRFRCQCPGYSLLTQGARKEKAVSSVREIMTADATCVGEGETITEAASKMRDLEVGALPICGDDDRLKGMITDRDIALQVVAESKDPAGMRVAELAQGEVVTIGADDSIEELIRTMREHAVRRVPVIDGHRLVGIVSQADVARNLPEGQVGELVRLISGAPSND